MKLKSAGQLSVSGSRMKDLAKTGSYGLSLLKNSHRHSKTITIVETLNLTPRGFLFLCCTCHRCFNSPYTCTCAYSSFVVLIVQILVLTCPTGRVAFRSSTCHRGLRVLFVVLHEVLALTGTSTRRLTCRTCTFIHHFSCCTCNC